MKPQKGGSDQHYEERKEPSKRSKAERNQRNSPERRQKLTYYQIIEKEKALYKKRCKYGHQCFNFPCKYWHEREEYFEIESISKFIDLINQHAFQKLCQYNLGDEKVISEMKKEIEPHLEHPIERIASKSHYQSE